MAFGGLGPRGSEAEGEGRVRLSGLCAFAGLGFTVGRELLRAWLPFSPGLNPALRQDKTRQEDPNC